MSRRSQKVARVRSQLLVGGTDLKAALAGLQSGGCGALIGTPGRLEDALARTADWMDVRRVEVLVLDEVG